MKFIQHLAIYRLITNMVITRYHRKFISYWFVSSVVGCHSAGDLPLLPTDVVIVLPVTSGSITVTRLCVLAGCGVFAPYFR